MNGIARAAFLFTCLSSRYRVIARKTQTVAWTKSATTAARTSPECASRGGFQATSGHSGSPES